MTDNNFHKLALSESFERVAKVTEERAAFNEAMDNLIAQDADLIDVASKVTEADREVLIRISNSDDETAQRIRRGLIYTWEVGEISRNRQYGYDQGYYDGRQADGAEERAKIVAWLRGQGEFGSERAQAWGETFADQIEAGEHLK